MDEHLNFDDWKAIDEDQFYDWRLVRKVLKSLKALRKKNDIRGLLGVLETCLRTNFAGVESARYVERHRQWAYIDQSITIRLYSEVSSEVRMSCHDLTYITRHSLGQRT